MKLVMLGIDLGKNLCSSTGLDETGAVVFRRRMKRDHGLFYSFNFLAIRGPIRRGTEPRKYGSFHRRCVLGVIRTTGSRFQYDLRHPTIGKGAHAKQRGVSEQQCDKHD
jgi:hypothetical protein